MNCPSSHSLFLRSNGSLVCWDDRGQLKELQLFDENIDYAELYTNGIYADIRASLNAGNLPFPEYCSNCCVMMTDHARDDLAMRRQIETFQIEPSMGCQLDCPGCIPRSERSRWVPKRASGHMTLRPEVLYKIVTDLKAANIRVQKFDMQGSGEPLLNKKIWDMCDFLADAYPDAIRSICTHANAQFDPQMVHSGVNEMLFSIDGLSQNTYAPWRVNGNFDKAYQFMHQFSTAAAEEAPHINRVWKYVLFDYNDSDEQLIEVQRLAAQSKINVIRFVVTQLGPASKRIFQLEDIPLLDIGGAARVTMSTYLITLKQLRSAIGHLQSAIEQRDAGLSDKWGAFVAHSIYRLFHSRPEAAARNKHIIRYFLDVIAEMPAERFGKFDHIVRQTTDIFDDYFDSLSSPVKCDMLPPPPATTTVAEMRTFVRSVSVDEKFYLAEYPDVAASIEKGALPSALHHFQTSGYWEGRLPFAPDLNINGYLAKYEDVNQEVKDGKIEAMAHFVRYGYREGRSLCNDR